VGVQVKLRNPLTTRAIPARFCSEIPSLSGAISPFPFLLLFLHSYTSTSILLIPLARVELLMFAKCLGNQFVFAEMAETFDVLAIHLVYSDKCRMCGIAYANGPGPVA